MNWKMLIENVWRENEGRMKIIETGIMVNSPLMTEMPGKEQQQITI